MKCLQIKLVNSITQTQSRLFNKLLILIRHYYRRFPEASATKCDDVVKYNLITHRVIFQNIVWSSYLIAASTNASIISMFGHGVRSLIIRASSNRESALLPVVTENSAASIIRVLNLLPLIEKNISGRAPTWFLYTDIIEQSLINKIHANLLGCFPIKSNFCETGH